MTDRVYPSTKPNGAPTPATVAGTLPTVNPQPSKTANLYNPNRHPYRPTTTTRHRQKNKRNFSCRRCLCLTCFWSVLVLIGILFLAVISAAAFYVLYHPERPTFSVTSLKISSFNLTTTPTDDSTHLTTKLNLTLSVKNTNKKVTFFYDAVSISVISKSVTLANTTFTNFTNSPNSIFVVHTAMGPNSQLLATEDLNPLNSDLKRKNGLPMKIVIDTMVGVKMEKLKMRKIGIRVKCEGIHGVVPKGRIVIPAVANTAKAKCKVDLRIKIWKFQF